jgi:zinc protease
MAYTTDPGLRGGTFEGFKNIEPAELNANRADAQFVLSEYFNNIMLSADPRYDYTALERAGQIDFSDVRALYKASMADTPISITVVGDVDEAAAVAEVGKTYGTLAKRSETARHFPGAETVVFPPRQRDFTLTHTGRQDQNVSVMVWPTTGLYRDVKASRGLTVLSGILRSRLFDALRKTGADYSPDTRSYQDEDYPDYGYVVARATVKPGGDGDFRAALAKIVNDLKTKPIDADEMARAINPIVDTRINAPKENAYWLGLIPELDLYPEARRMTLGEIAAYKAVTPREIMNLAQTYLRDTTAIHIEVVPVASATTDFLK